MILKTDRQQRNYNYLELIKAYNSAIEEYGYDAKLSKKEFKTIKDKLAVSLIGIDSIEEIINTLLSNDDNSLDLFYKNGEQYFFEKEDKILPVASKEEAEIVYSMLKNGDFELFLNENQKERIDNNLKIYFENINCEPLNLYDFIEVKGESLCADNLSEIEKYFTLLKRAVDYKYFANIDYYYNDVADNFIIQPIGFVYSQLDKRMRVKAFTHGGSCKTFYISNIKKLEIIDNKEPFKPFDEKLYNTKELVLLFENTKGITERVAARFSDYKKEIHYNKKDNTVTYHIYYIDTPTENNRIIFRLRSLGKGITILSEEKEMIKQDALKALENYKNES